MPQLAAVSYLNTLPLIWGFEAGPQRGLAELTYDLPFRCAERTVEGQADAGLMPVIEAARLRLPLLGDVGIACRGAVRSILLTTKVSPQRIRRLAVDSASRSSVQLARIVLAEGYGCEPQLIPMAADLEPMLAECDAALLIGDPALRLDPASLPFETLDLGEEWWKIARLPMVFAMWAGRVDFPEDAFRNSLDYGRSHMNDYLEREAGARGVPPEQARKYLTRHIVYDIGPEERRGMAEYLRAAEELELAAK